jgi:dTDP-4-dehydrorhamnose 3,5-epimerase
MPEGWQLPGAKQDAPSIDAEWQFLGRPLIEGVRLKEMRNVPTGYGWLTELWRGDWQLDDRPVDQVFQSTLLPGRLSAWHAHAVTTDRLCAPQGLVRLVLYDARAGSPTRGLVNELRLGSVRPGLVVIPPGVWHGVQNVHDGPSAVVNLVDRAYRYADPDHWRLPPDTPEIPYRFSDDRATSALW